MERILNAIAQYLETVPDKVRKRKWIIWIAVIAVTIFTFLGMNKLKFDMTIEGWFGADAPVKVALDQFHAEFGSSDSVFIVYQPKDSNVFSAKSLEAIKGIRNDLLDSSLRLNKGEDEKDSVMKHIVRVNTLINAPVLEVDGDTLISKPLVGKTIPTTKQELDEIRKTAESEKSFPLLYFSKDLKYGGILIETDFGTIPMDSEPSDFMDAQMEDDMPMVIDDEIKEERVRFKSTDATDYFALMRGINTILDKQEYADHLDYFIVGNAPMADYNAKILEEEAGMIYGGLIVVIAALLWLFTGSLSGVVWPILIVILSVIWALGFSGWLGITITVFVVITVVLILTVGILDSAHIISGYIFYRNKGHDHKSALRTIFLKTGVACLLTTITTMLGMLASVFTLIPHVRVFGVMSAVGMGFALLFTIYLLPLMLDLWSPMKEKAARKKRLSASISKYIPNFSQILQKILEKLLSLVQKRPYGITFIFIVIFAICIYGTTKVRVNTNLAEQFEEGTPFREAVELIDREMMGSQNMEIYLDLKKVDAFQDPFVLNIMDELQQKIEKKYSELVVQTSSLVEVVKEANQKMNEGRDEQYIIPANRDVLSQTLYLFNMANPEDRRRQVSDDYSKSHISVQLINTGSAEYLEVFEMMKRDIDEAVTTLKHEYPDTKVSITGLLALNMKFVDYICRGHLDVFIFAFLTVSLILIFVFGSLKAGFIAIVPNLIPAILTFGLLGLLKKSLDFDTMVLTPVLIGIVVDDTIHILNNYRQEVLVDGNIKKALQNAIAQVGQGITITSLILGLGFGIMAFSSITGTANTGRFGTLAILAALLCDLILLPALILIFKLTFREKERNRSQSYVLANPSLIEEEQELTNYEA